MTKEQIFDAIKDEDEVDIWVDDGDKMMSGEPTMDMAEWMLDNIEAGCRVEARVYYDENGNKVPADQYDGTLDVDTIFDSDDFIADEIADSSESDPYSLRGKDFEKWVETHNERPINHHKEDWIASKIVQKIYESAGINVEFSCTHFEPTVNVYPINLPDELRDDGKYSLYKTSNDSIHIGPNAIKFFGGTADADGVVSVRNNKLTAYFGEPGSGGVDLGVEWNKNETDFNEIIPAAAKAILNYIKTL